jgi:hypothetical protein
MLETRHSRGETASLRHRALAVLVISSGWEHRYPA